MIEILNILKVPSLFFIQVDMFFMQPTTDMYISPVPGYIYATTKLMQNVQKLTGTGGCAKYVVVVFLSTGLCTVNKL